MKRTDKECTKCLSSKPLTEFHKHKGRKDGYREVCKSCRKGDWEKDREKVSIQRKEYYKENRDALKEYSKQYRLSNPDKIKDQSKKYFAENKQKINDRVMSRYHKDPSFRLSKVLRARFYEVVIHNYRKTKWRKVLGCSVKELKDYLEAKFLRGMSWENHGKWHIDHIVPLSAFDLASDAQVALAFHYTNLQPLWARDNLSKGGRY
jgi:hypothetical protein